jgi:hypothetical protein
MSYHRDPDRATRGVGAIAAADDSPSRARLRSRVARATQIHDRAMGAVTDALSALGPGATVFTGASGTFTTAPTTATIATPPSVITTTMAPPAVSPPAPKPIAINPVAINPVTTTGVAVTSGGRAGIVMQPPPPAVPVLPPGYPDIPGSVAPDNTLRNVLLGGAAAVAAYLLLRGKQ